MKKKLKQILSKRRSPRKKMMDADDEQQDEYAEVTITTRNTGADRKVDTATALKSKKGKDSTMVFQDTTASAQDFDPNSNNLQLDGVVPMGSKLPATPPISNNSRQTSFAAESVSSVDLESVGNESVGDTNAWLDRMTVSTATKLLPNKRNNQISSQLSLDERSLCFERFKLFEASRRAAYGPKLRSSSAYWNSFKEMLRCSLDETVYVDQLIRASVLADLNYATHFKAALQGNLKPDGSPMLQHPATPSKEAAVGSARPTSTNQTKSSDPENDVKESAENLKIYSPYLQFLREVSLRFDEEAKSMQEGIGAQVTNFREKLEGDVSSMIQLGDFIHEQLKSVEEIANDNWSEYFPF